LSCEGPRASIMIEYRQVLRHSVDNTGTHHSFLLRLPSVELRDSRLPLEAAALERPSRLSHRPVTCVDGFVKPMPVRYPRVCLGVAHLYCWSSYATPSSIRIPTINCGIALDHVNEVTAATKYDSSINLTQVTKSPNQSSRARDAAYQNSHTRCQTPHTMRTRTFEPRNRGGAPVVVDRTRPPPHDSLESVPY
jgi:hypothetical protein